MEKKPLQPETERFKHILIKAYQTRGIVRQYDRERYGSGASSSVKTNF